MRVTAQVSMVINLDNCFGCDSCPDVRTQVWIDRAGVEYAWFDAVGSPPPGHRTARHPDLRRRTWALDRGGRLRKVRQGEGLVDPFTAPGPGGPAQDRDPAAGLADWVRIDAGRPVSLEGGCVGRSRYLGLLLYDADRLAEVAEVTDPAELLEARRSVYLDPEDPGVVAAARRAGVPADWIEAAAHSPVYELAVRHRVALPLHPERAVLPAVWYIPPLSPVLRAVAAGGGDTADPEQVYQAVRDLRGPIRLLANLFAAGDPAAVAGAMMVLAAVRGYMRERTVDGTDRVDLADAVGMSPEDMVALYRLLTVSEWQRRYVIPQAHQRRAAELAELDAGRVLVGTAGTGDREAAHRPDAGLGLGLSVAHRVPE